MTTAKCVHAGVLATLFFVGLAASVVLAKKPPPKDPDPPILYQVEWLPENVDTRARDAEFVNGVLVVVGIEGGLGLEERAFVYSLGIMEDLNERIDGETGLILHDLPDGAPLPSDITLTSAGCISDVGRIAGKYIDGDGGEGIYVYDDLDNVLYMHPLSDVYQVSDISDGSQPDSWDGTVVGWRSGSDVSPGDRGFVWQPAQDPADEYFQILPIDTLYDASGINRDGQVVGRTQMSHGYAIFRYPLETGPLEILSDTSNTGPTDFRITGRYSWARDRIDVNDHGDVAGNVEAKRFVVPAIYTDEAGWTELTKDRGYTVAINNRGQVCGITPVKSFDIPDTGFVDHDVHGYWSLNDLLAGTLEDPLEDPDIARWFSGDAQSKCLPHGMSAEDSTGWPTIVGYKWLQASGYRGFVLRPQSE